MTDESLENQQLDQRKRAWLHVLRVLRTPAQVTFFFAVVGAILLNPGSAILSGLGINLLSNLIDRLAHGEIVSEDEINERVQKAIAQTNIRTIISLKDVQSMIARQFRQFDLLKYAVEHSEYRIVRLITEQATLYEGLTQELHSTLAEINNKIDDIQHTLDNQPTREQVDEIMQLVRAIEYATSRTFALSTMPRTNRPVFTSALIGRDEDLEWFRRGDEDKLLFGQPGSGKTFLFRKLVDEGQGLFIVSRDRRELVFALDTMRPKAVIIDDDLNDDQLLLDLLQLRQQSSFRFSIWVGCWPGDRERIQRVLHLTQGQIRELGLLDQDQIVSVIKGAGLGGPNGLIHEIVIQAEGRPGLAVTLVYLCSQGDVQRIITGEALRTEIVPFFTRMIGPKAVELLAAFAVSGDAGMATEAVADYLQLGRAEVRNAVVAFDLGGVFLEVGHRRIAVRPRPLREIIVGEVFFQGAKSLDIQEILKKVPDRVEAVITLIGAKVRNAPVPSEFLLAIMESIESARAYGQYAGLGRTEATWVLQHYPQYLGTFPRRFLYHVPDLAIPLLLKNAVGDERPLNAFPDHTIRLIGDWVLAGYPGSGEAIGRRKRAFSEVKKWLLEHEDASVGFKLIPAIFSPHFKDAEADPGSGMTLTLREGYLLPEEMHEVQSVWQQLIEIPTDTLLSGWPALREVLHNWVYNMLNVASSDQTQAIKRSIATTMLRDIVSLAGNHPGILRVARDMSRHAGLEVDVEVDRDLEILYPEVSPETHSVTDADLAAIHDLATAWSSLEPQDVLQRIAHLETEARGAGVQATSEIPLLCRQLAANVQSPVAWLRVAIDINLGPQMVLPFLERSGELNENGWTTLAAACLEKPTLRGNVIYLALTKSFVPTDLVNLAFMNLDGFDSLIGYCCARKEVRENLLARLLVHPDKAVARVVASSLWRARPKGTIAESLRESWEAVIIDWNEGEEYTLVEILQSDKQLAYRWLKARLSNEDLDFRLDKALAVAALLDREMRKRLLSELPLNTMGDRSVKFLVGDDLELYQQLLQNKQLRQFHLIPLRGNIDTIWTEKARLALNAGYGADEIAQASLGFTYSWSGKESNLWLDWTHRFEALESHPDEQIRQVAKVGKARMQERYRIALEDERREAIYGRD